MTNHQRARTLCEILAQLRTAIQDISYHQSATNLIATRARCATLCDAAREQAADLHHRLTQKDPRPWPAPPSPDLTGANQN